MNKAAHPVLWLAAAGAMLLPGRPDAAELPAPPVPAAWSVCVLPGACRVFPVGEASPDVDLPELRRLKRHSAVWDSDTRRIRLAAARRETASFQLVVTRAGAELDAVEIRATALTNGAGVALAGGVRLFLAGYVEADGRHYPDILAPFSAGGVSPFAIPHRVSRLAAVPGQENQAVWADLDVPADAAPGAYGGVVSVAVRAGGAETTVALALDVTVLDLSLPAARSVGVALDTYGGIVKHLKLDSEPEAMLDLERRFYRLARAHRMFIHAIAFPQSGKPRPGYMPEFARDARGRLAADWSFFDRRYGPYLDGSAFDDGVPIEQFPLYVNLFWPAGFWPEADFPDPGCRSPAKARYEDAWMEHAREYVRHFREKGWTRTTFLVKMNHYHRPGQAFPLLWNMDMPRTNADFRAVAYYADLAHRAFAGAAPADVKFRLDTGHSFCGDAGCPDREWDACRAGDTMAAADLWFFDWRHGLRHRQRLAELKARGRGVYVYHHGWTCAEPASVFRGFGWVLQAAGLDGYCAYNHPHDDLLRRRPDEWNNYVMYVGWDGDRRDAFASVRLKLQRDSLADCEYFRLAAARDPARAAAVLGRLVRFDPAPPGAPGGGFSVPAPVASLETSADARRELAEIAVGAAGGDGPGRTK
jgi:hypothetical protein